MSNLPSLFVAYRPELTTDPNKENMTYYHLLVNPWMQEFFGLSKKRLA